jgi:hypothetical protein
MRYYTGLRSPCIETRGRCRSSVDDRHVQIMTGSAATRARLRCGAVLAGGCAALALVSGCGATAPPGPIRARELAEAQTFPYYRIYWTGPRFEGRPLVAADGRKGYNNEVGDSVYYGDCVEGKGVFGGGSTCTLPLQVTTVVYRRHSNAPLGPQRNMLIRGVPATAYDEGRSIELYSGRLAIDVFSDTPAHALAAARALRPLNASGSPTGSLPRPVYCPGLSGAEAGALQRVMASLPGRACQRAVAQIAFTASLRGERTAATLPLERRAGPAHRAG